VVGAVADHPFTAGYADDVLDAVWSGVEPG
jgi:hypothetical protein